jgi:hypothetical protein
VHAALDSVAERLLRRPRLVRDRILGATSDDGLTWQKSGSPPIVHPSHRHPHMTYFAAHDDEARLWVRASVHDGDGWHTELGQGRRWFDMRELGLRHFYAPSWVDGCIYGVAIVDGRPPRFERRRSADGGAPRELVESEWEDAARFTVVHDLHVVRGGAGALRAYAGVGESDADVAIHAWTSDDGGARWTHEGVAVASPFESAALQLANNPAVVALDGGGWRMYFRTGEQPALGNSIRSARSDDGLSWQHEEGARIAPGGRWDTHGVGFPHVWGEDGGWRMLYAGYWGDTPAAEETAAHWHATEYS